MPTLLILGDELETLVGALAAARLGFGVTVLRQSTHWLGGLSTRGGLSYMDMDMDRVPPVLLSLIQQAGWQRVALQPDRLSVVLWQALSQAGVRVVSGVQHWQPLRNPQGELIGITVAQGHATTPFVADWVWDGTPDACLARACGVTYRLGLGGLLNTSHPLPSGEGRVRDSQKRVFNGRPSPATPVAASPEGRGDDASLVKYRELSRSPKGEGHDCLAVSPVFEVSGVTAQAFAHAVAQWHHHPNTSALLADVFPHVSPQQREAWLATLPTHPAFCPPNNDYLDILTPLLGALYHRWRYGLTTPFDTTPFWMDGANIARLPNGRLGFNGLIARPASVTQALGWSVTEASPPPAFVRELAHVQSFLRQVLGLEQAVVHVPVQLYVRQSVNTQMQVVVSAHDLLEGGCPAHRAVASFSYWFDLRGVHPWAIKAQFGQDAWPLPKPVFNVGLAPFLPVAGQGLGRLVVVSRSAGFSPLAQGACRIVQHLATVAEALACALWLAHQQGETNLLTLPPNAVRDLWQAQLASPLGLGIPPINGKPTWQHPTQRNSPLLRRDAVLAKQLALGLGVGLTHD